LHECGKIRGAAEVETGEHGVVMVTVAPPRPDCFVGGPGTVLTMTTSDLAELSSLRAQLEDLVARVVAIGDRYRDTPDSAVTNDLELAERSLLGARRALERASSSLAELD
jgi:hypothetical protein